MSNADILPAVSRVLRRMVRFHRLFVILAELGIFLAVGTLAFLLRFDLGIPSVELAHLVWGLAIWVPVKLITFRLAGLDRGWGRFVSMDDLSRVGVGNLAASGFAAIFIAFLAPRGFPRSIYLIDLLICFLATAGVRALIRIVAETADQGSQPDFAKRTLIYGAGVAGDILVREIRANRSMPYRVLGFLDDNSGKRGLRIQGLPVIGTGADLANLVRKHAVEEVLIAIPSATGPLMTDILGRCHGAGIRCKTVPGLAEVLQGGSLTGIRNVDVEDLLGRTPVHLEENQIRSALEGNVVLVTGAAGSIGSELCRQIVRFNPAGIVGFDIAESPLFEIDREMRLQFPGTPFHTEIGSIQNRARLDEVLRQYSPSVVYHAAAYKHVPLMEAHVFEAIENNVIGTYNLAVAAAEHGVEDFVMISSDKAVRPTNVMGATKRIAELLLLALQNVPPRTTTSQMMEAPAFEAVENNVFRTLNLALAADHHGVEDFVMISSDKAVCPTNMMGATKRLTELVIRSLQNGTTKFVSVRFGNVLGSNGSVVPIFKQQIARGGPVTVTHPDMRRFFMTIPEACLLVLQSSTMGKGGEIFVLDMGEPVKIVDLARNLILLSGLRPGEDIKIEFTGARPGEKLFEELSTYDENTLPTHHEKVKIFAGTTIPWPLMEKYLNQIRTACTDRNLDDLVLTLKDLIPEYNPSAQLLRSCFQAKSAKQS